MARLTPELQELVTAKEALAVKPKYFIGNAEVKVYRAPNPLSIGEYIWYEITDHVLRKDRKVADVVRREPPFHVMDDFA